ncbi:hypothetical protein JCM10212_005839 [Sporobolomyces blumeae]
MPSPALVRDSTFGQLVNWASNGRYFPYDDQRPGYVVPARYLAAPPSPARSGSVALPPSRTISQAPTTVDPIASSPELPPSRTVSEAPTTVESIVSPPETLVNSNAVCKDLSTDDGKAREFDLEKSDAPVPAAEYPFLVTFDENDPDRPQNWSSRKRNFVGFLIALLTFSIYVGSAIYTPSIPGIMEEFGASQVGATAGLTLFVAGYGISPMVLAPMQEVGKLGRNPVYIGGLAVFVIFNVPPLFAKNLETILVSRFIQGLAGGPALATGGASMGDIFPPHHFAVALSIWSMGAVLGPIAGPVIGGFAAQYENWKWPFLELLWISGAAFVVLFFVLPETYEDTVLLRRAQRLRKLTGNELIKAPCEVGRSADETVGSVVMENMYRAIRLSLEPSILVANSYIALVYAIFYLWFEAFPLTFEIGAGFSLGLAGLPYLGFVVSGVITLVVYIWYQLKVLNPRLDNNPELGPEVRLELALFAAVCIPISLFGFGWTAQTHQHWMLPIVFAAVYLPGIYLAFQSIMVYISISYPKYAASVLAGNDLFRSVFASVFPLFGTKFFGALGLGGGSSLLAGVSILMIPVLYTIMKMGATLRARSRFAE